MSINVGSQIFESHARDSISESLSPLVGLSAGLSFNNPSNFSGNDCRMERFFAHPFIRLCISSYIPPPPPWVQSAWYEAKPARPEVKPGLRLSQPYSRPSQPARRKAQPYRTEGARIEGQLAMYKG